LKNRRKSPFIFIRKTEIC